MSISIKLQAFEGPLDLLLHLIDKNKVNIYDIPIVLITDQYLEYVNAMDKQDLDVVSEFLVMAATLIDIKSKMLLPKNPTADEDENEDPRKELVERLLEYKKYKLIADELKDMSVDAEKNMYKIPTIPEEVSKYEVPVDLNELLSDITISKLNTVFQQVMKKQVDKIDPIRSKFGKIEKEEVNLEDKIDFLMEYVNNHEEFSFKDLLESQNSKMQIVVMFLAILEMIKIGRITVVQEEIFDDIIIRRATPNVHQGE